MVTSVCKQRGPDTGSQNFIREFYQFHKNACHAWYIKDINHQYTDASMAFLSRFLPAGSESATGLIDNIISPAPERDIQLMHDFEMQVITQQKEITLLTWNYFSDISNTKSFILNINPYPLNNGLSVLIFITDLADLNKKTDWLSALIPDRRAAAAGKCHQAPTFNPLAYVTEKEWEVAWLILCGCSIRWIARYFGIRSQAVYIKSRNVFMKLRVINQGEFIHLAEQHGWINIIPERFVSVSRVIRIG